MIKAPAFALCLLLGSPAWAQTTTPPPAPVEAPMTPERLSSILLAIDPEAVPAGPAIEMTISDVPVLVFMDGAANRMRAIIPISSVEALTPEDLMRVLQANFDTALDARYAVANGRLWSVFVHPLRELQRDQLISGLAQTVTLAQTYGDTYASGVTIFGSGDSPEIYGQLLGELQNRGEEL